MALRLRFYEGQLRVEAFYSSILSWWPLYLLQLTFCAHFYIITQVGLCSGLKTRFRLVSGSRLIWTTVLHCVCRLLEIVFLGLISTSSLQYSDVQFDIMLYFACPVSFAYAAHTGR